MVATPAGAASKQLRGSSAIFFATQQRPMFRYIPGLYTAPPCNQASQSSSVALHQLHFFARINVDADIITSPDRSLFLGCLPYYPAWHRSQAARLASVIGTVVGPGSYVTARPRAHASLHPLLALTAQLSKTNPLAACGGGISSCQTAASERAAAAAAGTACAADSARRRAAAAGGGRRKPP